MKTVAFLTVLLGSTAALAAQAPSASECQTLWAQASQGAQNHTSLSPSEAAQYISSSNFKQVDSNSDGSINQSEFQTGCSAGLVQSTPSNPG